MKRIVNDIDTVTALITTAKQIQQALDGHGFTLGVLDGDTLTVALDNGEGPVVGVTIEPAPALVIQDEEPVISVQMQAPVPAPIDLDKLRDTLRKGAVQTRLGHT